MNKEDLLQELSTKINTGEIDRQDLLSRLNIPPTTQPTNNKETKIFSHSSITKVLYVLGATIVFIGIIIFASQIWDDIGSFGHIAITLGIGLLLTALGSMLLKQEPENNIGPIFHFIGGILIPGGVMVTLSELGIDNNWPTVATFVFGGLFAFYLFLNTIHKHVILTLLTIINGTIAIYLLLYTIIDNQGWSGTKDVFQYLTITVGASYLFLAHTFRTGWNNRLVSALYFFGSAGFLGATFSQTSGSIPGQLFYFLIVFGGLFLSTYTKSRSILIISTFFLLTHISYITGEYFANSLGWPISLVILGFIFIGLGYTSITINKKYIRKTV